MTFGIEQVDALEVIVKVAERCNINCTYCYMFNKGNDDYLRRPAYISPETVNHIVDFLVEGVDRLQVKQVSIVFHGGEPLMMKKERFRSMCARIRDTLDPRLALHLSLQTNAMLIDDDWIDIFSQFKIDVGVSLDGPQITHDRFRVDHKGNGTHDRVLRGIEKLQRAYNAKLIRRPGAICVIDPTTSAREIFEHLVGKLGFVDVSFNLPMETVDTASSDLGELCATYLVDLLAAWESDNNPRVRVRIFDQMLRFFSGDTHYQDMLVNCLSKHLMVVIAADGELSEHDDFKVINFGQATGNVRATSLYEFANSELREYLNEVGQSIPAGCAECDWRHYCRAGVTHGLTVSRYSKEAGFNNKSSMCAGFAALFEEGARFLLRNGLPIETLESSLRLGETGFSTDSWVRPVPENLILRPNVPAGNAV